MSPTEMEGLGGTSAIVTGASRGIGRAIGARLCALGSRVLFVARSADAIADAVREAGANGSALAMDITADEAPAAIVATALERFGKLDIVVHAAGFIVQDTLEASSLEDFDEMHRVNVRAPVAICRAALPALKLSRGQVLFVNSSIVRANNIAGRGGYAATKHALKAVADSFRDEVNQDGVRVLSIMAGSTATSLQRRLHELARKTYSPERLLQPEDIAQIACNALAVPRTAEITDVLMRPMMKG